MSDTWLDDFTQRRAERADRDLTVKILDEQLAVKSAVAPETILRVQALGDDIDGKTMLNALETAIREILTTDSLPAWERLRSPDRDDPLNLADISDIYGFLLGKVTAVPTVAPSGSPSGPRRATKRSAAGSSSRAETPTG